MDERDSHMGQGPQIMGKSFYFIIPNPRQNLMRIRRTQTAPTYIPCSDHMVAK